MNQIQDDEIDLFELFQTLWHGKGLISAFVALALLLGSGFLLVKDAVYESKLIYSVDTAPPFYGANKALTDFQKMFYSVSVFEDWKEKSGNSSLVFEDFSATEVVDGFVLSKDENEQLATLTSKNKGGSFVLVKSNNLLILDNFFKYATHINKLLTNEYVVRANEELKIIESRFNELSLADSTIVQTVLLIDRYIVMADKGANALSIQPPTMPEKVSPKPTLILAMCVVLGGMIGVFFILVRNAIKKRKEQLAKA